MRDFQSVDAFVKFLTGLVPATEAAKQRGIEDAAYHLANAVKRAIGREDQGWVPLSPFTVREKNSKGQVGRISETDPLLATGEMRETIGIAIGHNEAAVGSDLEYAVDLELGTRYMPARPFLGGTAMRIEESLVNAMTGQVAWALMGKPPTNNRPGFLDFSDGLDNIPF